MPAQDEGGADIDPARFSGAATPEPGAPCAEYTLENTLLGDTAYPLVAWSADGQMLASASGATIRLYDPDSGGMRVLKGHLNNVYFLVFSPDGSVLASSSRDGRATIKLWDPHTGRLIKTLHPGDDAWAMAFSPDGSWLASGGTKRPIKLWRVRKGKLLRTFSGHGGWALSLAFSPDGALLASGGRDRAIRLWDSGTESLLHTIPNAFSFHVGPQGQPDWPPYVAPLAFSPDGSWLVSGSGDGRIRIWDPRTGALIRTLIIPPVVAAKANSAADPGGWCKTPLFYPRAFRRPIFTEVWSVAFSPDGGCLASGTRDGAIRLWDFSTGALVHTLRPDASSVRSVVFSPDGTRLASASHGGSIKLWKRVEATGRGGRASEASPSAYEKTPATGSFQPGVPVITSVTRMTPQVAQVIIIKGHGFGIHPPYLYKNTPYIAIHDDTDATGAHWEAGHVTAGNWDAITLSVRRWTDTEIQVTGFGGAYGRGTWKLNPGDEIKVEVWNSQTGAGPATYELTVSSRSLSLTPATIQFPREASGFTVPADGVALPTTPRTHYCLLRPDL